MSNIPWQTAQQFGEQFGKTQVVIWCWGAKDGQHVVTWGGPALEDSLRAAEAGNHVKRAAGWTEDRCKALPESLASLLDDVDETIAEDVASGVLHKGTALAVLYQLREAIRRRDPDLADKVILARTEKAEVRS